MIGAASIAVVRVRLAREAPGVVVAVAACALAGYVERWSDPAAQLAGALIFGGFVAIAAALVQHTAVLRDLEISEWSAPFYGRQLARAGSAVPCIIASAACLAYWGILSFFTPPNWSAATLSLVAVDVAALLGMRAGMPGRARWLALGAACAMLAAAFFGAVFPLPATASIAATIGFFALRAYGEALRRYGPPIPPAPEPMRVSRRSRG